ncbi:MAG: protein translocase subunit SecF [Nitrospinota bacterium]
MIKIIQKHTNVDFIGCRKIAAFASAGLIVLGILSLIVRGGFNVGIDFTGGTMVQILFEKDIDLKGLRSSIKEIGYGDSEIQQIGGEKREFIIRTVVSDSSLSDLGKQIQGTLAQTYPENKAEIRRVEMVGPKVGADLRHKALQAFFYALGFMLVYVWWRFELSFGVGAILALLHDIFLSLGFMALFHIEFDLKTVAALLTVVGYSINDTIVVYDRIRENLRLAKRKSYTQLINKSINQTLSRTLLTSVTALIVVLILFLFGGEVIHGFSFVLLIGIITGTYSSIFIASPIVLLWEKRPGTRLTSSAK